MARGGGGKGRRTYVRDNRGRFASSGGGGGGKPKTRMASRGKNRLTRDNAGKITSVGGTGATARGGRLKTASGKARGKVLAKGPVRLAGPGMIRKSDVRNAGIQNAISKKIERRQKAGLNKGSRSWDGTPSPIENAQKRLERAQARIAGQKRKPAAPSKPARRDQGDQRKRAEQRALKTYTKANNQLQRYTTPRLSKRRNTATRAVAFLRGEKMPPPLRKESASAKPTAQPKQRKATAAAPKGRRLDEKTRGALKGIAGRTVEADNRMISSLARAGKVSKEQAAKVFDEYMKRKLIKRQGIDNATIKHGGLMSRSVIRGALKSMGERPAPLKLRAPRSQAPAGRIRKPKDLKPGALAARRQNAQKAARPALTPSQVAGQRKRAGETQEAFAKRKLPRVSSRISQLSQTRDRLQTDLNRRRGRLEGDDRRKAAKQLAKTKKSISRLKDAEQAYETTIDRRGFERDWNLGVRGRRKAPDNARTARNRFDMLRRRTKFMRREEPRMYDVGGTPYAGPGLAKAKKELADAVFTLKGQRVFIRSRGAAVAAQRKTRNKNLRKVSNSRGGRNYAETSRTVGRISIGTARQGNLLTGRYSRVRTTGPRRRR